MVLSPCSSAISYASSVVGVSSSPSDLLSVSSNASMTFFRSLETSFFVRRLPGDRLVAVASSALGLLRFLLGTVALATLADGWARRAFLVVIPGVGSDFCVDLFCFRRQVTSLLVARGTWLHTAAHALLISLPQKKAYTKGKACTRCRPNKKTHYTLYKNTNKTQYKMKYKNTIREYKY